MKLSGDAYKAMLTSQGGACAICRTTDVPQAGVWISDHNHDTGSIRGLLCNSCNVGIGMLKDDPALLRAAIAYLEGAAPPNCTICGEARGRGGRYCSRNCAGEARRRAAKMVACRRCGFRFRSAPSSKRRFCSVKCYRLAMVPEKGGPRCWRCGFNQDSRVLRTLDDGRYACLNCIAEALWLRLGSATIGGPPENRAAGTKPSRSLPELSSDTEP